MKTHFERGRNSKAEMPDYQEEGITSDRGGYQTVYKLPALHGSIYPCLAGFLKRHRTCIRKAVRPWRTAPYHRFLCLSPEKLQCPRKALARIIDKGPRICFRMDLLWQSSGCSEILGQIFPKGKPPIATGFSSKTSLEPFSRLALILSAKGRLKEHTPFSSLIAVAGTSKTLLNKRGESGHPCLVPDLRGNVSSSSPSSMMLAVEEG